MTDTVHGSFERWARRTPEAVAVVSGPDRLTYAELDAYADEVARRLAGAGVLPGDRVGVAVERSAGLIVALLGILKAGAAYLPLEAGDPAPRLAEALVDAGVSVVVVDRLTEETFGVHQVRTLRVGDRTTVVGSPAQPAGAPGRPGTPTVDGSDLAYLMYTSGSTGRPKAVMVEHRNIVNLVSHPTYVELGTDDRLLHLAPVTFDAATFEIWGALLNGARLVVAPPGPMLPENLAELLRDTGVTVLWLTAALFHRQIDENPDAFRSLRTVIAGGDVLSGSHIRRLMAAVPGCQIVNGYGPTEATTFTCAHRISPGEDLTGSVPIGRPIQNVTVRILDPSGAPVPDGTPGELCIGGAGVARGYWRRPELTRAKFGPDPLGPDGARLYRSGDLARRRDDGVVEFLGRLDGQFKLRGYRVEPGEIENLLTAHPEVRQAAVAVRTNHLGDARLIAYLVTADARPPDRRRLRAYLRERLPGYLVPAVFVTLPALPVTPNGKADRAALPTPDWTRKETYV